MDQVLLNGTNSIVAQYGLLGIAVVFLLWYIGRLQQELKDLRDVHKQELAAKDVVIASKDKRIDELQEARVIEGRQGYQLASATKTTLENLFAGLIEGAKS